MLAMFANANKGRSAQTFLPTQFMFWSESNTETEEELKAKLEVIFGQRQQP